jgi:opacity protein-like surface antigen
MRRFLALLAVTLAFTSSVSIADETEDVDNAVAAARAWLSIVDAGKFGESWDRSATTFQKGIAKANWEQAVGNVRVPIGALRSRILMKGADAPKLVKLAAGHAVVIQFISAFEKLAPAIETVTPFREQDGSWRVSGYYIKPVPPPAGAAPPG